MSDNKSPNKQTIGEESSSENGLTVTTDEGLFTRTQLSNGTQNAPFEATDHSNNYAQKGYFLRFTQSFCN